MVRRGLSLNALHEPIVVDEADVPAAPRRTRGQLWMTCLFWGSSGAALGLADVLKAGGHVPSIIAVRVGLTAFGILLCFLIHLMLHHLAPRPFRIRVIALVVVAPIAAEMFAWANYGALQVAQDRPIIVPGLGPGQVIAAILPWTWLFLAWAGFYFALEYAAEADRRGRHAARLRALAQDAKLRALAYQISPHFLFNSLNAVSALVLDGRVEDAERTITRLSRFLRRTLAVDPGADITLGEEISIQQEYLAIEQQRFPDLGVQFDIPAELTSALVPALILQPLVENAVKHGVARALPPTAIRIGAKATEGMLEVSVHNEGAPASTPRPLPAGAGMGLANVRQRLAQRYGEAAALRTMAGRGGSSFDAIVILPRGA